MIAAIMTWLVVVLFPWLAGGQTPAGATTADAGLYSAPPTMGSILFGFMGAWMSRRAPDVRLHWTTLTCLVAAGVGAVAASATPLFFFLAEDAATAPWPVSFAALFAGGAALAVGGLARLTALVLARRS